MVERVRRKERERVIKERGGTERSRKEEEERAGRSRKKHVGEGKSILPPPYKKPYDKVFMSIQFSVTP